MPTQEFIFAMDAVSMVKASISSREILVGFFLLICWREIDERW
jgi:hypothetical protein